MYINSINQICHNLVLITPNVIEILLKHRSVFYMYHPNLKFTKMKNKIIKREHENSLKKKVDQPIEKKKIIILTVNLI